MIYSKIISDSTVDKIYTMKELSRAFEDNDKLQPIRCLTGLLNIKDPEHFLLKEPPGKKLEDWGRIAGTLASTIATAISALVIFIPGLD
jgi:hypothetical protein